MGMNALYCASNLKESFVSLINRISIPYASNGIFIEIEAGYYKLSSEEHSFVAKADINGNIQIIFADEHYNKTCGLCGNFNGFAEDDFMTQEGKT